VTKKARKRLADWPVIFVPNGTDISRMKYTTINLAKFLTHTNENNILKEKNLQDVLELVT
jgi:hypothetical protein